jgi:8-amino-3,8-dideoxy-alpha-D-manno-octulosonate transaminase
MSKARDKEKLGLQGGMKAVGRIEGRGEPKIGIEEFMSVIGRFGVSPGGQRRIRAVLKREDWGAGPFLANYYSGLEQTKVQAYEAMARRVFGSPYAIGTSSGTGALHAAFVAAGVGPGTEVICPAIGFIATAQAVVLARGVPVFCDADNSLAMDPAKIEALVTPRTVAIAPTQVMGSVCDMGAIMKIARRHKLRVVEDCAQSCGARWRGRRVGTIGDLGCFSIAAYKIVGGGEGGLILAKDRRLWERASQVVESGGLWRPERFAPPRYPGELFCGANYRLSELEAAIDVVQLRRLDAMVNRFRAVKRRILERLRTYREILPQKLNDPDGEVGYLLRFFPASVELAERIAAALKAEGISCSTRGRKAGPDWHLYSYMYPVITRSVAGGDNCPLTCPVYRGRGGRAEYARGDCPVADDLFDRMVSVNLNQWYTPADCRNVAAGINKVLSAYCTETAGRNMWL